MSIVVITTKPEQFPNYYTYTAYEFLVLSQETLKGINCIYIAESIPSKKYKKVEKRAKAFTISIIPALPEDVIDVAESNVVRMPTGNVYVNRFKLTPKECFALATGETTYIDATVTRLSMEVVTLMEDVNYEPTKGGGELFTSILELMFQGLGKYNTNDMRQAVIGKAIMAFTLRGNISKRMSRHRDISMLKGMENLRDLINEKRPGMFRRTLGFTAGEERVVKPKAFLQDPSPVRYFKTKQELAEYLASKLPETVEIRKRNALKFKICCELGEAELLKLATDLRHQQAFIDKYC